MNLILDFLKLNINYITLKIKLNSLIKHHEPYKQRFAINSIIK